MDKVALCAIGRLENRYAVEFVEHYLSTGFDCIFIYDNNQGREEHFEEVLSGYDKVEIVNWRDRTNCQLSAYNHCYINHKYEYDWIAFFDFDEFLIIPQSDIHDYLCNFTAQDCILINWMMMTDNNIITDDGRPCMERFTEPMPFDKAITYDFPENDHIKSIVRGGIRDMRFTRNPHIPGTPLRCCDTKGNPCQQSPFHPYDFSNGYLRHFCTKTIDEWLHYKVVRGYPDKNTHKLKMNYIEMFFARNDRTAEKEKFINNWEK